MILLIDNYDSFTYNIYQTACEFDDVLVYRNDKITVKDIEMLKPSHIIISPGPGVPKDAGISIETIKHFKGVIPILGICLGHQCIAEAFNGKVVRAKEIFHGKTSKIYIKEKKDIFQGIDSPFEATRYHSLIVSNEMFPKELKITASTQDGEIMALRHISYQIYGVQFHPESILTTVGPRLIENFINIKVERGVSYV
ncbi:anthranilate synthase subunit II [Petrotoga sp. HWH.PT.55.6.1]|jgi:anthranilate synthase/aminodeoxychorismate synthase-like glutamine amidotransferase|uniref:anthranilate synthase component II n=1 Tax=unclassified Petrotoga TaxID=2620614 RepID=UPI000CC53538|nr:MULTISPECIES: aminodeoxychorismate/anthranilate synthase component II [unclassified Petrotoga]PNR88939.1 anthranilate synthase subunit II [Petrotoga sp. 9T1HF07.CasAA.8.2]PNR91859.1 anthranilate synthase subunit II [Petrotoga sp. HWHPT.55.6.3]RPD36197.1 anthranilate synthase subunit II [Petrotoga sp. HWH.PT.55.6.1]